MAPPPSSRRRTVPAWAKGRAPFELLAELQSYDTFARALVETCLVNDPWFGDEPIFSTAPLRVEPEFFDAVRKTAESLGALYDEFCQQVWQSPDVLDSFFKLPPFYKLMWLASEGHWHGFARFDLFWLDDGRLQICEVNADTPTGQVEAHVPGELLAQHAAVRELDNPNAAYAARLLDVTATLAARRGRSPENWSVGLLYPTDLSEDITLIRLYQRWFEAAGHEVVLGSPDNLSRTRNGGVALFGRELDVVLRHYKTDWWGERPPALEDDEPIPDEEPLAGPLLAILDAEREGKVTVVNPFGSVLPQNKLAMAYFWAHKDRFSEAGQACIEAHVPRTFRLDDFDREQLKRERSQWVLKSDYGCEGDEVLVGRNLAPDAWEDGVDRALPGVWVVQEHLDIAPLATPDGRSWLPNLGPFLLGGQMCGLLVRLAPEGVTCGHDARVVPPFIGVARGPGMT